MNIRALSVVVMLAASTVSADPQSPYAGQESRTIKALSADQINGLLNGEGMSLALAAELNGYPGPRHVLDLADELALDSSQRARSQALFDRMRAAAIAVGHEIVAQEGTLERLFASHTIDSDALAIATDRIGQLQAELRRIHLDAHIQQTAILTRHQVAEYVRLRGYAHRGHAGHAH